MTWNARFFELLDLPHAYAQVGTPLIDIVRFLAARGDLGDGDAAALTADMMALATSTRGALYQREDGRGRTLEVRLQRLESGLLVTYSDVTERHRAGTALRESEERYALAAAGANDGLWDWNRSEEHTSELQSLMRSSYAVFCLK